MGEFALEILTPEKQFFDGLVEAAICPTSDGNIEILKGHQNLVAALGRDEIKLKIGGKWQTAVVEDGFFEVRPDKVIIFAMFCDKIENYEREKRKREESAKTEKELHKQNLSLQKINSLDISKLIISAHKKNKNINF
ncbi:MAG: ATP synthase F1 subunit epsilon [Clostridia bacterium]|nr:ATP synthase F1 subunit epsilon [Clostridia bacterium]